MARAISRAMSTAFADPATLTHDQLEEGTAFAPRFDAHGLITAVAQDESGRVLMVAHMNAEALRLTIDTGEVHYYSRSRKALWKKGETSGEVQKLIRLATDCDQDVVLLTVEQTGRGAVLVGPMAAQLRVRDAVEGAGRDGIAQTERAETFVQLAGRLASEREREHAPRVDRVDRAEIADASRQHACFARARAGDDAQR